MRFSNAKEETYEIVSAAGGGNLVGTRLVDLSTWIDLKATTNGATTLSFGAICSELDEVTCRPRQVVRLRRVEPLT